jgi:very-short-patch-repair endonuclease
MKVLTMKDPQPVSVPESVLDFLGSCSEQVGKCKGQVFHHGIWTFFQEHQVTSPLEQMLYCALRMVQELNALETAEPVELRGKQGEFGLRIEPQRKIGKYRVDLYVAYTNRHGKKEVVVECHPEEPHEWSTQERRYHQARDRHLAARGYRVLRYTGTQIMESAPEIALEIISRVTGESKEELRAHAPCGQQRSGAEEPGVSDKPLALEAS